MDYRRTDLQFDDFTATMVVEGAWDVAGLEPDEDTYIDAAQHLIDTGLAWHLQGFFGRQCQSLIDRGFCHEAA